MQKAGPPEFANTMESILNTPVKESMEKARSSEYFEAWKRAAEKSAHLIFASLPLRGPTIPDELKEEATDLVCRLTWWDACEYMTDEEKIAACHAKRREIDEYVGSWPKRPPRSDGNGCWQFPSEANLYRVLHRFKRVAILLGVRICVQCTAMESPEARRYPDGG